MAASTAKAISCVDRSASTKVIATISFLDESHQSGGQLSDVQRIPGYETRGTTEEVVHKDFS